jgi:hypothetical protein
MFVDFEVKSMKEKGMFVVDPVLHTQNCRNITKNAQRKERKTT